MQPSDTLCRARLWWAVLTLFSPLLTAAPPGGHSLHLARVRDPTGRVSTLGIASEISKAKHSLPVLKDIWINLERKQTFLSERTHVPRSDQKDRLLIKENSRKEPLLLPVFAKREGHAEVEPYAGQTDSSVVFAAVFCSLMGTVLAVLMLVLGFVVWREAYEVSERKRKLRDPLCLVEESAYLAYPRDDSPSNFPPVYSQFAFGEKDSFPNDLADANTRPASPYHHQPVAPVHSDHGYRRSRSSLRMNRRPPKKIVRIQVPRASLEPSFGKRYTQYDVTGIELSDAQKWHRMQVNRRAHRY